MLHSDHREDETKEFNALNFTIIFNNFNVMMEQLEIATSESQITDVLLSLQMQLYCQ